MSDPSAELAKAGRPASGLHRRRDRVSLTDVCVQMLTDAIELGIYSPGSPLPSETDLAEQPDVSRATLRQALRTLEDRHLVVRRHGRGTFVSQAPIVRDPHRNFGITAMIRAAGYHPGTADQADTSGPQTVRRRTSSGSYLVTLSPPCGAAGWPTSALSPCPLRSCPNASCPPPTSSRSARPASTCTPTLTATAASASTGAGRAHPRQGHCRSGRRPGRQARRPPLPHEPGRLRRDRKGGHVRHRIPPARLGPLLHRAHRPGKCRR